MNVDRESVPEVPSLLRTEVYPLVPSSNLFFFTTSLFCSLIFCHPVTDISFTPSATEREGEKSIMLMTHYFRYFRKRQYPLTYRYHAILFKCSIEKEALPTSHFRCQFYGTLALSLCVNENYSFFPSGKFILFERRNLIQCSTQVIFELTLSVERNTKLFFATRASENCFSSTSFKTKVWFIMTVHITVELCKLYWCSQKKNSQNCNIIKTISGMALPSPNCSIATKVRTLQG